jgi:hypothetical protein
MHIQLSWVFAVAVSRLHAEQIIERLKTFHVPRTDVSVLLPGQREVRPGQTEAVSATRGIAQSGALGWVGGLDVVSLPDRGAWLAGGPLLGSLEQPGSAGLMEALQEKGAASDDARRLVDRLEQQGSALVAVRCDNPTRLRQICRLLQQLEVSDLVLASQSSPALPTDQEASIRLPRFA